MLKLRDGYNNHKRKKCMYVVTMVLVAVIVDNNCSCLRVASSKPSSNYKRIIFIRIETIYVITMVINIHLL